MKTNFSALLALLAANRALAQQACSVTEEVAPSLTWSKCSAGGSCAAQTGSLVIDANWRWTHTVEGYDNCYEGNSWDSTLCPDGDTCAQNCCSTFSNIKFGPIGSTFTKGEVTPPGPGNPPVATTTPSTPAPTQAPGGPTAPQWGQCGGQGWSGATTCVSGTTCTVVNDWYHQCL
ncbi:hypothetical protein BN1723_005280 [Verticillium longisporum]|uniref:Glucanase n=1 Tax=Verticillium longisporum TaxID=100787 RepID=A0A0G4N646_VERLO|nr:hypothetical protein BN1723_005280 [Verticillium longisporum]